MAVKFGNSETGHPDQELGGESLPGQKRRQGKGLIKPRPQIVEPRCKVCQHAYRNIIDRMLVLGVSYNQIELEFASEGDNPVHRKNLSNHHKKHMTYEDRAIREVLEEEAKRIVENVDELKTTLVTSRGFMQTMLMKSYTMMMDGTLKTEARDVIQMINLMEKMNEDSATIEKEELMREFNLFAKAVKNIVPSEMWNLIVQELQRLNSLDKSIVSAHVIPKNELPSAERVLDAEEVEETEDGSE